MRALPFRYKKYLYLEKLLQKKKLWFQIMISKHVQPVYVFKKCTACSFFQKMYSLYIFSKNGIHVDKLPTRKKKFRVRVSFLFLFATKVLQHIWWNVCCHVLFHLLPRIACIFWFYRFCFFSRKYRVQKSAFLALFWNISLYSYSQRLHEDSRKRINAKTFLNKKICLCENSQNL